LRASSTEYRLLLKLRLSGNYTHRHRYHVNKQLNEWMFVWIHVCMRCGVAVRCLCIGLHCIHMMRVCVCDATRCSNTVPIHGVSHINACIDCTFIRNSLACCSRAMLWTIMMYTRINYVLLSSTDLALL
jgi:hypothetical protein